MGALRSTGRVKMGASCFELVSIRVASLIPGGRVWSEGETELAAKLTWRRSFASSVPIAFELIGMLLGLAPGGSRSARRSLSLDGPSPWHHGPAKSLS